MCVQIVLGHMEEPQGLFCFSLRKHLHKWQRVQWFIGLCFKENVLATVYSLQKSLPPLLYLHSVVMGLFLEALWLWPIQLLLVITCNTGELWSKAFFKVTLHTHSLNRSTQVLLAVMCLSEFLCLFYVVFFLPKTSFSSFALLYRVSLHMKSRSQLTRALCVAEKKSEKY